MKFATVSSIISENKRPVVSFDFDGVCHVSIVPGTHHPDPRLRFEPLLLQVNSKMISKMREEAKDNEIVIVSARDEDEQSVIEDFISKHRLPVRTRNIYLTGNRSKKSILKSLNAIRHYDDHVQVGRDLRGTNIEFIHVKL